MEFQFRVNKTAYKIQKGSYTIIGSEITDTKYTTIQIKNNIVSKKHAAIGLEDGSLKVMDLCSDSGTRIGDLQLKPLQWYNVTNLFLPIKFGFMEGKFEKVESRDDSADDTFVPSSQVERPHSFFQRRSLVRSYFANNSAPVAADSDCIVPATQDYCTQMANGDSSRNSLDNEKSVYIPETQILTEDILMLTQTEQSCEKPNESQNLLNDFNFSSIQSVGSEMQKPNLDFAKSFSELVESDDDELSQINLFDISKAGKATEDNSFNNTRYSVTPELNLPEDSRRSCTPDIDFDNLPSTSVSNSNLNGLQGEKSNDSGVQIQSHTPEMNGNLDEATEDGEDNNSTNTNLMTQKFDPNDQSKLRKQPPIMETQIFNPDEPGPSRRNVSFAMETQIFNPDEVPVDISARRNRSAPATSDIPIETQIFDPTDQSKMKTFEKPVVPNVIFDCDTEAIALPDFKTPFTRKRAKIEEESKPKSKRSLEELNREMSAFDTETQPLLFDDLEDPMPGSSKHLDKENSTKLANGDTSDVYSAETQPLFAQKKRLNILRTPTPELYKDESTPPSSSGEEELDQDFCERSTFRMEDKKAKSGRKIKKTKKKVLTPKPAVMESDGSDDERVNNAEIENILSKIPASSGIFSNIPIARPKPNRYLDENAIQQLERNESTPPLSSKSLLSQTDIQTPDLLKDFPSTEELDKMDFNEINKSQCVESESEAIFNEFSDEEEKQQKRAAEQQMLEKKKLMKKIKFLKYDSQDEPDNATKQVLIDKKHLNPHVKVQRMAIPAGTEMESKSKTKRLAAAKKQENDSEKQKAKKSSRSARKKSETEKAPEKLSSLNAVKSEEFIGFSNSEIAVAATNRPTRSTRNKKTVAEVSEIPARTSRKRCAENVDEYPSKKTRSASSKNILKSHTIAFSNIKNVEKIIKIVNDIGGSVVEDVKHAESLVIEKFGLTTKVLAAICKGIPIVSSSWILDSKGKQKMADISKYLISDKEHERRFKYSLKSVLTKSLKERPFKGYNIIVTQSTNPTAMELKTIIECAGANFFSRDSSNLPKSQDKLFVVAEKKDLSQLRTLKRKYGDGLIIISADQFVSCILKQKLDFTGRLGI